MPLSIIVGLSRKAGKDYQSTGVSINVTAELDQSLLTHPDELRQEVAIGMDHNPPCSLASFFRSVIDDPISELPHLKWGSMNESGAPMVKPSSQSVNRTDSSILTRFLKFRAAQTSGERLNARDSDIFFTSVTLPLCTPGVVRAAEVN